MADFIVVPVPITLSTIKYFSPFGMLPLTEKSKSNFEMSVPDFFKL
jgi:hypothetical protein